MPCVPARRGSAIEVVADRAREDRSQLVFTKARGRDMVFWQSPRTVKQARLNVALPKARAGGLADLEIIVDTRERVFTIRDPEGNLWTFGTYRGAPGHG